MIDRPLISMYDYVLNKKADLFNAYSIEHGEEFGGLSSLSFKYPMIQIDANGNNIYNERGEFVYDLKADLIVNEHLIKFKNDWFIIKNIERGMDNRGAIYLSVSCINKADELGYKQVRYLDMSPPIKAPVDAQQGILEILTLPYQTDLGYGKIVSASSNTVVLGVTTNFNFNGRYIVTLEGAGKYQQRTIIAYNTTTKTATLNSAFSPQVNSTTVFRVHNSKYTLGTVSPTLINDGTNIFRSMKFEDVTIADALNTLSERFNGNLTYTHTTFDGTKFLTYVNLVIPTTVQSYEFRYQKNIQSIKRTIDTSNGCYTRLYPEGRNNLSITSVPTRTRTDSGITYNEHTSGTGDMFNFQYWMSLGYTEAQCRDLFIKDFTFVEEGYTDPLMLYDGAKKALADLAMPKITYEVSGVDLSVIGINPTFCNIGDRVRVIDNNLGFDFLATVITKTTNFDSPQTPSITLTNFIDVLGDLYYRMIKYQEGYSWRKGLYGKGASVIIADELTSTNWRYADYFVPADGSITADVIIQKAMDDLAVFGGGEVKILKGDYYFKNQVTIKSNISVIGEGDSTKIISDTNNIAAFVCQQSTPLVNSIAIKNISFLNKNLSTRFIVILSMVARNVLVENCTFNSPSNRTFYFDGSQNVKIINNRMVYNSITINVISIDNIKNVEISNNIIEENYAFTDPMIHINNFSSKSCEVFISNNYITTNAPLSSQGQSILGKVLLNINNDSSVSIVDNTFVMGVEQTTTAAIAIERGRYVEISRNTIDGGYWSGIIVGGYEMQESNVVVDNNSIFIGGTDSANMWIGIGVQNHRNATITNNMVRRGSRLTPHLNKLYWGIAILSCENVLVSGNNLTNSGTDESLYDAGTNTILLGGNKL